MGQDSSNEDPRISVIISAYNRKKYLMQAVLSVLNQSLPRKYFEIIVIKNFLDEHIDSELDKLGIMNIHSEEKWYGAKLAEGIAISRGNVLCFLDDDDMYSCEKLSRVNEFFENPEVDFYKNTVIPVYGEFEEDIINNYSLVEQQPVFVQNGNVIQSLRKIGFINPSSMCIRKNLIGEQLDQLKKNKLTVDIFLFYNYLERGNVAVIDGNTSYYRIHNESQTHEIDDLEKSWNKDTEYSNLVLTDMQDLVSGLKKIPVKKLAQHHKAYWSVRLNFFAKERQNLSLLTYLRCLKWGFDINSKEIIFFTLFQPFARLKKEYFVKKFYEVRKSKNKL